MPRRLIPFQNHIPYLIFHKGIDHAPIFQSEQDRYRLVYHLYCANFGEPVTLSDGNLVKVGDALLNGNDIALKIVANSHPPLTYILGFSITKAYLSLILMQRAPQGISKYMQKLITAYAKYYNARYHKKGTVFDGRFKAKPLDHLEMLDYELYIPSGPEAGMLRTIDQQMIKNMLVSYKWCSYQDIVGRRCSHILPPRGLLHSLFGKLTENSSQEPKL